MVVLGRGVADEEEDVVMGSSLMVSPSSDELTGRKAPAIVARGLGTSRRDYRVVLLMVLSRAMKSRKAFQAVAVQAGRQTRGQAVVVLEMKKGRGES